MSPSYVVQADLTETHFYVYDTRRGPLSEPVAGPFCMRDEARDAAVRLEREHFYAPPYSAEPGPSYSPPPSRSPDADELLLRVLDGQAGVNESVSRALEALALQADRYDLEIAELRRGIAALTERCETSERAVRAAGLLHSVKS